MGVMYDAYGNGISKENPLHTESHLIGNTVVEQKTEANVSAGKVTFGDFIDTIEIYNSDTVDGKFTVNGVVLTVPAGKSFYARVKGTPSKEVVITGSTKYIITRFE